MDVIQGGYQKGLWFHDRGANTQEEINFMNEAFQEAGKHDPRWLELVWDVKVDSQLELRQIK